MSDNLDELHRPPFNCECGRGKRVTQADGQQICTQSLFRFRMQEGYIPERWLPLRETVSDEQEQAA